MGVPCWFKRSQPDLAPAIGRAKTRPGWTSFVVSALRIPRMWPVLGLKRQDTIELGSPGGSAGIIMLVEQQEPLAASGDGPLSSEQARTEAKQLTVDIIGGSCCD